tara:strand:+ start:25 stop:321 length:297 start_codon:yes stop_codon:yes gene_type:complete
VVVELKVQVLLLLQVVVVEHKVQVQFLLQLHLPVVDLVVQVQVLINLVEQVVLVVEAVEVDQVEMETLLPHLALKEIMVELGSVLQLLEEVEEVAKVP